MSLRNNKPAEPLLQNNIMIYFYVVHPVFFSVFHFRLNLKYNRIVLFLLFKNNIPLPYFRVTVQLVYFQILVI